MRDRQSAADAADLITEAPQAPASYAWTGFYFGGHLGYATGSSAWTATDPAGGGTSGTLDLNNGFNIFKGTGSFFAGLQGGYNIVLPSRLLLGVEADASFPNMWEGSAPATSAAAGTASFDETALYSGTVRARVGYAFDHWLIYATGGLAWSYDQIARTQVVRRRSSTPGTDETALLWRLGWTAGAGVALPVAPHWSARLEYLFSDFGRRDAVFPATPQWLSPISRCNRCGSGLDYAFSEPAWRCRRRGVLPIGPEEDIWNVHGQTTFTEQYVPPFHAPYRGQNSLDSNSGRETCRRHRLSRIAAVAGRGIVGQSGA